MKNHPEATSSDPETPLRVAFLFSEYSLHNHVISAYAAARPKDELILVKVPLVLKGKGRRDSAQSILPMLPSAFIREKIFEFCLLNIVTAAPRILPRGAVFRRLWRISRRLGIPYHLSKNVMSEETLAFVRSHRPDLVITLFHQIIKRNLIDIPRLGIINIHPGLLPDFKGIQPYFWALSEGAQRSGATFHLIEDEGIDTGRLLARVSYDHVKKMSVQLNYFLTAQSVALTLPSVVHAVVRGEIEPRAQPSGGAYYKWPDSEAVARLERNGHSLTSLRDLASILGGAYDTFSPELVEIFRRA